MHAIEFQPRLLFSYILINQTTYVDQPKTMRKFELLFISIPGVGHLVPIVEFSRRLTNHDRRLSATILVTTLNDAPILDAYIQSRTSTTSDIKFLRLPPLDPLSPDQYQTSSAYISIFIDKHKPHVKHAITSLMMSTESDSVAVAGFFVDMFCTAMIDVANELGIPCYLYFPSPASYLGFTLHLPTLDTQLATEFVDSETGLIVPRNPQTELNVPSFVNPLPPLVLPTRVLRRKEDGYFWFLYHARRYIETKGIVVNTFRELEPHAIGSVSISGRGVPPVYPVGPVLDLDGPAQWHPYRDRQESIMRWLDDQPPSSVVFLCFGSKGSVDGAQVKEIALGLDRAGFRFLWSLRKPAKGETDLPGEYTNLEEVLPNGFLVRTEGIGLVCGWVPQVTILAHEAIGGFVSHCGWNSTLESLWYGVPIATWPLHSEQQLNAFQLVKELGLGVEIRLDYREGSDLVSAEELQRSIKQLMDGDNELRRKFKEMKEKSRLAVMENGSSYQSLTTLIEELTTHI
ncbi:UDPGT domain-containing protein [Cephalotus follicularis]|uniref:Glycosyltransferase n=1 Tax=Cephalotus follicularis TaxID=3775 RepID=A0A1Q3BMH3_CEPFO|nr:UDPGT domain-containing protein [Cephalotus follicularis]